MANQLFLHSLFGAVVAIAAADFVVAAVIIVRMVSIIVCAK